MKIRRLGVPRIDVWFGPRTMNELLECLGRDDHGLVRDRYNSIDNEWGLFALTFGEVIVGIFWLVSVGAMIYICVGCYLYFCPRDPKDTDHRVW